MYRRDRDQHRPRTRPQARRAGTLLSKITLAQTWYGHFYIEHNRGHHVRVATPEDPASARFGETFWEFAAQRDRQRPLGAKLEAARIRRQGRSPWDPRTWPGNDVLNAWAMSVVLWGALTAVFGWGVLPYMVISAVFGFSMLESVNYLEHYGLLRQKNPSGRYERVRPEHSWNSDHLVTNLFLYHLQRHSDHHRQPHPALPDPALDEPGPGIAERLRDPDRRDLLPAALAEDDDPPAARALQRRHHQGQRLDPRRREKILARYGSPAQTS